MVVLGIELRASCLQSRLSLESFYQPPNNRILKRGKGLCNWEYCREISPNNHYGKGKFLLENVPELGFERMLEFWYPEKIILKKKKKKKACLLRKYSSSF
jgi:hypothetical protein